MHYCISLIQRLSTNSRRQRWHKVRKKRFIEEHNITNLYLVHFSASGSCWISLAIVGFAYPKYSGPVESDTEIWLKCGMENIHLQIRCNKRHFMNILRAGHNTISSTELQPEICRKDVPGSVTNQKHLQMFFFHLPQSEVPPLAWQQQSRLQLPRSPQQDCFDHPLQQFHKSYWNEQNPHS